MKTDTQTLEVRDLSMHFGAIRALEGVDLTVHQGEIVGLVGDNGAGKSTLVKIVSGLLQPTHGEVFLEGEPVTFTSPRQARQMGIETVHQDLALCDNLDIASNFFLGRELTRNGPGAFLRRAEMRRLAQEALDEVHIKVPGTMSALVEKLSGGQRQAIAIARAAFWRSKLLLLDEPTAALGVEETAEVVRVMRTMADEGLPMVLISHNMAQVHELCDRVCVLRQGRKVAELEHDETTAQEIVEYITGAQAA